jgi:hypothetical protein
MNIRTALVFLHPNCTCVLAQVNCYPPQNMSTAFDLSFLAYSCVNDSPHLQSSIRQQREAIDISIIPHQVTTMGQMVGRREADRRAYTLRIVVPKRASAYMRTVCLQTRRLYGDKVEAEVLTRGSIIIQITNAS